MKALNYKLTFSSIFLSVACLLLSGSGVLASGDGKTSATVTLERNNIRSWIWDNGIFNKAPETTVPGFEWPKNSGRYAVFSSGFNIGAYIQNQPRLATSFFFDGEYLPGYCTNGIFITDSRFKLYKVSGCDNWLSNPDWANWGQMVPFGAPFVDINNSGTYEPPIDIPGVKDASQTIFLCMTDADSSVHNNTFPFYGNSAPLGAEVHLVAWCYDLAGLTDVQFFKWTVINKNNVTWDSVVCSVITETDLGNPNDDAIGCDTTGNLGVCYNFDNNDEGGYGFNPPAYGMRILNCGGSSSEMESFTFYYTCVCGAQCEQYPLNPQHSYNFLNGLKRDFTPFVIPNTNPPQKTKYVYSALEGAGWHFEDGSVLNCGTLYDTIIYPGIITDTRFIMSSKPESGKMNPGDTFVYQMAQLTARGTSNLNSIGIAKNLSDAAYRLCQNGFVIGINPISSEIPQKYNLYQNYPNPFNPATNIKFTLPHTEDVTIKIYDALGREIVTLVDEKLNPGVYSADWDASDYPSCVYFYRINAGNFTETRKMILIK